MKIVRKIISYILAVIVVILMSVTIILAMINNVIFSKSNVKKHMNKVDYYTEISNIIKDSANNYIMQSGFDESIMDSVIPKEKINNDIDKVIDAIYEGKEIDISTEEIRANLDENVQQYIQQNNYKVDAQTRKDIAKFEDKIESIYENSITYSKNAVKQVVSYFKMAKRITRLALITVSILLIILAFITYKINKASFGISLLATGIICIFIKCYSGLNIAVNNILMVNKTFSNLMINLINQVVQYIFISGIILTVLGIFFIIIFERKSRIMSKKMK